MENNYCRNCRHFCQHYTLDQRRIFRVCCGHCTLHKVTRKAPDSAACKSFRPGEPDQNAFVSKEYLSKELLQYLLHLELLPPIE